MTNPTAHSDLEASQAFRLSEELAETVAVARAKYDEGYYADGDEVEAWIESWFTEDEKPLPQTRKR